MIRRKKRLPPYIPVASMADIAFLLIIFFMLTSNFVKNKNIDLSTPESSDIWRLEEAAVTVSLDRTGVIRLNGQAVDAMLLEDGIRAVLKDVKDRRVQVQIDKDMPKSAFMPVLEAVARADVEIGLLGEKLPE